MKPALKVPLSLAEAERQLILDDLVYIEEGYASVIRATPTNSPCGSPWTTGWA